MLEDPFVCLVNVFCQSRRNMERVMLGTNLVDEFQTGSDKGQDVGTLIARRGDDRQMRRTPRYKVGR